MMTNRFLYELPTDPPPDMEAVAQLARIIDELRAAVGELAVGYADLRQRVDRSRGSASFRPPQANGEAATWTWLIDWTDWLVNRYELHEELGSCWPRHPALVEELTALASAWEAARQDGSSTDSALRWHEAFARARVRWQEWDARNKCRTGLHRDRGPELQWPVNWRHEAHTTARADVKDRSAGRFGVRPDTEEGRP